MQLDDEEEEEVWRRAVSRERINIIRLKRGNCYFACCSRKRKMKNEKRQVSVDAGGGIIDFVEV